MTTNSDNLGVRSLVKVPPAHFPSADEIVHQRAVARRVDSKVDVLLVNPPSPDGAVWIRSQHRVGRRSRENMLWPQVCLAQLAALLSPDYTVDVIDAIALNMTWDEFERLLRDRRPRYYLTQLTAPTLTNDMRGVMLARSQGSVTIAFGTHITPMALETLSTFPCLDYALRGEPEMSLRELIDTLEARSGRWAVDSAGRLSHKQNGQPLQGHTYMWKMWTESDTTWRPAWVNTSEEECLAAIKGLAWRKGDRIIVNPDRPFIRDLDDLPIPLHHLLPLNRYRAPLVKGPYSFIVTSRGCPAGCKFCIKHVSYQYSVRLRSADKLIEEIKVLVSLGVHHVQMYADLFTVSREQVVGLCERIIEQKIPITWSCNSRVDFVDAELLRLMKRAGCNVIAWGIESANEMVLKNVHKGYRMEQAGQALKWSKEAGILNWAYFIIGLPGETPDTIRQTIALSKQLPADICLFHVAAPYPGTPFFFDVVENGWFRPGTNWEEVDMDNATVLDYPGLKSEDLLRWQKRAFREWAMRPGPLLTYLKSMNTWYGFKSAVSIGLQSLGWVRG